MLRKQSAIFLTALVISLISLVYSSRALADLTDFSAAPAKSMGVQLMLHPTQESENDPDLASNLAAAQKIITQRLEKLGVPEPYQVAVQNSRLVVSLPATENIPYITSIIVHTGEIAFIDGGAEAAPIDQRVEIGQVTDPAAGIYEALFTGEAIEAIQPPDMAGGEIFYQINVAPAAAQRLTDFIENQAGHHLCIVIDQEVIGCSKMYHFSEETLEILPNLTSGSMINMADLALFLESGPLPLAFEVQ